MIKGLIIGVLMFMATMTSTPTTTSSPVILDAPSTDMDASLITMEQITWQDCNVPGYIFTEDDIYAVARMLYGEARCCNVEGQAGTVWCVLNRLDSDDPYFPDTVLEVVEQPSQFTCYHKDNPVVPELVSLVEDVFMRYDAEKSGIKDVGRVLPREYLYFSGDGERNYFTVKYASIDIWDWSLHNPYTE